MTKSLKPIIINKCVSLCFLDATGVYPVTDLYGVQCGYTYSVDPQLGRVVLRASYFSCHTDNKVRNDRVKFQDNAHLSDLL